MADILFGKVSPSGKLPLSFYHNEALAEMPDFTDYSMQNRTYRYFTDTPVFPFGHGLSYSDIRERWLDDKTVEVSNCGDVDTAYAVLRYAPLPDRHLIGFEKIFLAAKETKIIRFER